MEANSRYNKVIEVPKNYKDRDRKLQKKNKMPVNSKGLITVILPLLAKKAKEVKKIDAG